MKQLFTLLALTGLSLTSAAQDWQPFRQGRTYHFTQSGTVDSLFNFRVTPGPLMAGDAAWEFNPVALAFNVQTFSPTARFLMKSDNQFGHWLVKRPGGVFEFLTDSAGSFIMYTQATVGQSWVFNGSRQATLLSRGSQSVSASVTDSVQVILISGPGFSPDTLVLSRNYGLLQTPAFMAYVDSRYRARKLTFHALPEQGIGSNPITFESVFDFQPGDRFQRYYDHYLFTGPGNNDYEGWYQEKILSKVVLGPDSIQYTLIREQFEQWLGGVGGWQYSPPDTGTVTYYAGKYLGTDFVYPQEDMLSQGFRLDSFYNSHATFPIHESAYNQRFQINLNVHLSQNQNFPGILGEGILPPGGFSFAQGLGCVYYWEQWMPTFQLNTRRLTAYTKGAETYGTFLNLSLLAAAQELQDQSISVFPNPVSNELTLRLPESIVPVAQVQLHNVMGKLVWQGTALSEQSISLINYPAGMYLLTVQHGGRAWHTKVMKE